MILEILTIITWIINCLNNKYLKNKYSKRYFIICYSFILILFLYTIVIDSGYNHAKNKTNYIINDNYIFIYNTNEYGIGCKYELDENSNIVIIDTSKYIKLEIIGLLLENKAFDEIILGKIEENNNE